MIALNNRDFPKVSVVTITYQHQNYIIENLKSIISQKYNGIIEVIIANDNSPDQTDKVIKEFFEKTYLPGNIKIKYTKHDANKGMMKNFIWALCQASGKYIALCEGDDYWTDTYKIQKQIDFLELRKECSMCFHAAKTFDEYEREFSFKNILQNKEYKGEEFLKTWLIPTASVVFRNKYLDEKVCERLQNPNYIFGDIILFLSLESKGKVFCINEIMSVYRIHGASALREFRKNFKLKTNQFINHHLSMSKDFDGRYRKINFMVISDAYYRLILEENGKFQKIKYLNKFNYFVFRGSKKTFFSMNHQKTMVYNFFTFLIN